MKIKPAGRPKNKSKYEFIISLRKKKKSLSEIGEILGMTKQGVHHYIVKYGDVELSTGGGLDK